MRFSGARLWGRAPFVYHATHNFCLAWFLFLSELC